jgi:Xaa-Pro dipeptidase
MNERELHALFAYTCHRQGSSGLGYNPIVGAGKNSAILHYGDNNSEIEKNGDLILVDAGCDYRFYASDITRCYPVGGKFTEDSKNLYNAVLEMQEVVLAALKDGVKWEDMHYLAMDIAAKHLVKLGICNGTPEELVKNNVVAVFFPHGLGHSIGLDVHDVGGYPKGTERIDVPGVRYLRMRRTLAEGNVVTVEPGIYFAEPLIDFARNDPVVSKYLNNDVIDRFIKIGGVRIEDDVVITKDGHRNLTTVPKTVEEIEALCAQSA